MNLCAWLLKLTAENLAVSAFVGALWSFVAEMFPRFNDLSYSGKRWAMLGLCLSIPILALVVSVFGLACPGAAITPDSVAQALAAGCAAFATSQIAHLRKPTS